MTHRSASRCVFATHPTCWTAAKLRPMAAANFLGTHRTGIEPVYQLRQRLGLSRANCCVGAVGARFTPQDGLDPGALAR